MPPTFPSGPARGVVLTHALFMAVASLLEGVLATIAGVWGGMTFFDPSSDLMVGFFAGGYGLVRVVSFLLGMFTSLVVLLSANSIGLGHRRFVLIGGLLSLGMPFVLLGINGVISMGCSMWYLPALTAIPAAVVLFDGHPTLPPSPPREEW